MALGFNMTFPIYVDVQGEKTSFFGLALRKATVDSVVMSLGGKITGDVVYVDNSLVFSMKEYVEYNGARYYIVNPPTVTREGMVSDNTDLKGMTKYSLEFYHPEYWLSEYPFSDIAVSQDETRYLSQNKTFSWIGNLEDYVDKLNKNLSGSEWKVVLSDKVDREIRETLSDVLSFDDNTIADALKTLYETWKTPFTTAQLPVEEDGKKYIITVGLPSNEIYENNEDEENDNPFVFVFGQGVGLKNNSRTSKNNKIITRIAPYGSENNIPYGYPQIRWYGNQDWEYTEYVDDDPTKAPKPTAYPLYMGIVGGAYVKLIKHPFTRKHLMPSVYAETIFNKTSPYAKRVVPVYTRTVSEQLDNIRKAAELSDDTTYKSAMNALYDATMEVSGRTAPITVDIDTSDYSGSVSMDSEMLISGYVVVNTESVSEYEFEDVFNDNPAVITANESYDPDAEIIDYYDAVYSEQYPFVNEVNPSAPSYEAHEFEDIKPELGDESIIDARPYSDKESKCITVGEFSSQMDAIYNTSEDEKADILNFKTAVLNYGSYEYESGGVKYSVRNDYDHNVTYADYKSPYRFMSFAVYTGEGEPHIDVDWDDTYDTEKDEYVQSYFRIKLPQLSFDLYACAAITQEMQINMRSGDCLGCTFPIQVDWDDYKKNFYDTDGNFNPNGRQRNLDKYPKSNLGSIEVLVQKETSTFGVLMPNVYQRPKSGDTFVILGISLPLSYIESAETRLDEVAMSYMLENNIYYYEYPLKFDEYFLATHTYILRQIKPNSVIRFRYADEEQKLYVKQLTVKYGESALPKYDITLTDNIEVVQNQIGQAQSDIQSLGTLVNILNRTVVTQGWIEKNFVSVAFFDKLFGVYDGDDKIATNRPIANSGAVSIKTHFGLWTEQFISALGKGGVSGGSASSLDALVDVDIPTMSAADAGKALVYDGAGHWTPQTVESGVDLEEVALYLVNEKYLREGANVSALANDALYTTLAEVGAQYGKRLGIGKANDNVAISLLADDNALLNEITVYGATENLAGLMTATDYRTLHGHVADNAIHITTEERSTWNATTNALNAILGTDSDDIINKWEEVVAFLESYGEADTLAGLLSNKADKATKIQAGTGLAGGGDLASDRTLSLAASGVAEGTYTKVTVDRYGRVTVGSSLSANDIPDLDWSKIATGKPSTLAGYGIADAKINNGVITLGSNSITPVTSVAMTVPTGFSVTGSPVSKTGTFALSYTAGYEGFTTALKNKIDLLYSLFTREGSGTSADPYVIKANYGLYTEQFLSALGQNNSQGEGGASALSELLDVTLDGLSDGQVLKYSASARKWVNAADSGVTSVYWENILGKPSTYTPSEHNHDGRYYVSNGVIHLGGNSISPLTSHQSLSAYTKTADFVPLTIQGAGTTVGTYSPTSALSLNIAAGSNITITADAINKKITIANTYSYSLPLATNGTRGGMQIGFTTNSANRNYAVLLSGEKAYVNVPWTDTDTKVTSVDNHYSPTADSDSLLSASASGATAAWNIDVVKGIQIQRDAAGHVTGVTVTSGKIPANPNTNTWRGIYTNGTSRVGSGTDTKAVNYKAGSNINVTFAAAGTGSGQSGNANYFDVIISAANVYDSSVPRTANTVLAAPNGSAGAATFRSLVAADIPSLSASKITSGTLDTARIPDLSATYATASRATTLEGYFVNGVAKTAAKLSTVSKTAWGQTYWTSDGVPTSVSGNMSGVGNIAMNGSISGLTNINNGIVVFGNSHVDVRDAIDFAYDVTVQGLLAVYDEQHGIYSAGSIGSAKDISAGTFLSAENYIQIGSIRIGYDSTNNALKVYKYYNGQEASANFYALGSISALGQSSGSGGGVDMDTVWTALGNSTTEQINATHLTTALSAYATLSWVSNALSPYATEQWVGQQGYLTAISAATASALGGIKVGYITSGKNYKVQLDSSNNAYVNVPWTDTIYSLPLAASGTRGGIQLGYTQSGKNYPVQLSSEKAYVNVPWENTTYSAGTGLSASGTIFSVSYAPKVLGSYTQNGGQQNPNYFGTNRVGFLMMNTTVNGNSQYKDWVIMDCYNNDDVGGGVAIGVNRQSLGAYIMRSAAARTSWEEKAELCGTHNSSVSLSGDTLTVKIAGVEKSLTNTNTTYSAGIGISLSGTTFSNSGVRSTSINGNYLRVNTNGTNVDLTIPYATNSTKLGGYTISDILGKRGENLVIGSSVALVSNWVHGGWPGGGIETYDTKNGIYKMYSYNGWHTLATAISSEYANKAAKFSLEIMCLSEESTEYSYIYFGASQRYFESSPISASDCLDTWVHFSGNITFDSTPYFGIMIRGTDSQGKKCTILVRNLKVETGSLESIWTPAPTDIGFYGMSNDNNQLLLEIGNITKKLTIDYATSASKLSTSRTINGTSFDGSANITTANWGTARNISIADSDSTNTGTAVSVNGSAAVTLKLPATIKAALTGNASTATKLQTLRTIWGQNFDGSGNVSGAITGATTISASSNVSVGGTLGVTGATTLSSTLGVSGLLTASGGITIPGSASLTVGGDIYANLSDVGWTALNGEPVLVYDGEKLALANLDINTDYVLQRHVSYANTYQVALCVSGVGDTSDAYDYINRSSKMLFNPSSGALLVNGRYSLFSSSSQTFEAISMDSNNAILIGGGAFDEQKSTHLMGKTVYIKTGTSSSFQQAYFNTSGLNMPSGTHINIADYRSVPVSLVTLETQGSTSQAFFGQGAAYNGFSTYLEGGSIYLRTGTGRTTVMTCTTTYIRSHVGFYSDSYVSALGQNTSSDIRKKEVLGTKRLNVVDIANAPSIQYLWKGNRELGKQVGSVAQYWENMLPEAIHKDSDGYMTMQYGVIALLSAIATAKKVVDHERRIEGLERENERLRAELEQLRTA